MKALRSISKRISKPFKVFINSKLGGLSDSILQINEQFHTRYIQLLIEFDRTKISKYIDLQQAENEKLEIDNLIKLCKEPISLSQLYNYRGDYIRSITTIVQIITKNDGGKISLFSNLKEKLRHIFNICAAYSTANFQFEKNSLSLEMRKIEELEIPLFRHDNEKRFVFADQTTKDKSSIVLQLPESVEIGKKINIAIEICEKYGTNKSLEPPKLQELWELILMPFLEKLKELQNSVYATNCLTIGQTQNENIIGITKTIEISNKYIHELSLQQEQFDKQYSTQPSPELLKKIQTVCRSKPGKFTIESRFVE